MPRVMVSGILTKEQVERGYRVVKVDDHFVELWWYRIACVAIFSADGTKDWAIREAADRHWAVK